MSDKQIVPRSSGVYKITCTVNNKIYVGSAKDLRVRWNDHRNNLKNKKHHNPYLQHAWDKYGESAFEFEIIELVMPWSRVDREQYWLDKLKPWMRNVGFNVARHADTPALTPETRKKMSQSAKNKAPMSVETRAKLSEIGKRRSPEHVQKLLEAHLGSHRSEETRHKISEANKNRPCSEETKEKLCAANIGKTHSDETKRKMSESHKGQKKPPRSPEHQAKINAANKGRKHTEETRRKMSESRNRYIQENGANDE